MCTSGGPPDAGFFAWTHPKGLGYSRRSLNVHPCSTVQQGAGGSQIEDCKHEQLNKRAAAHPSGAQECRSETQPTLSNNPGILDCLVAPRGGLVAPRGARGVAFVRAPDGTAGSSPGRMAVAPRALGWPCTSRASIHGTMQHALLDQRVPCGSSGAGAPRIQSARESITAGHAGHPEV